MEKSGIVQRINSALPGRYELVPDVHQAARWWSLRWLIVSGFCGSAVAAYALLPPDFLPTIPQWAKQALAIGTVLSAGMAGAARVIQQPGPKA